MTLMIADASVLINFLKVDRMQLLGRHQPACLITEHVRQEVTDFYADELVRLTAAIGAGLVQVIAVSEDAEIEIFSDLVKGGRLGEGECSAIAVALHRKLPIAMDDARATKDAKELAAKAGEEIVVWGTADIIVRLIRSGDLTIEQADFLLVSWRTQHKFHLKIQSFAELL